jgi:hypothetical protein
MGGCEEYRLRSGLAGKYRIGLNIVRTGKIGVKGLFLEYGEYSAKYSPTPSLKPLSWVRIYCGMFAGYVGVCACTYVVSLPEFIMCVNRIV